MAFMQKTKYTHISTYNSLRTLGAYDVIRHMQYYSPKFKEMSILLGK